MIRFEVGGVKYEFEQNTLLLSESLELQKQTGMTIGQLDKAMVDGDVIGTCAYYWVAVVRQRAAEAGQSFRDAARGFPFADWDPDIKGLIASVERLDEPENPTAPPTDGPAPSPPDTSGTPTTPQDSDANESGTSACSPTT